MCHSCASRNPRLLWVCYGVPAGQAGILGYLLDCRLRGNDMPRLAHLAEAFRQLRGCPEIRIRAAAPNRFQTLPVYQSACFIGVFGRLGPAGWGSIRLKTEFRDSL